MLTSGVSLRHSRLTIIPVAIETRDERQAQTERGQGVINQLQIKILHGGQVIMI